MRHRSAATGKPFDVSDPPAGTTYIGRCVGKQLFISDVDEKKKLIERLKTALVRAFPKPRIAPIVGRSNR